MKNNMGNNVSEPVRNNLIGNGTNIKGEVEVSGDIRIDGSITGTLKSNGKVVVGQQGYVEGTVICKSIDISGKANGTLKVEELTSLRATSKLEGELFTKQLFIEVGAIFTGKCDMTSKPVENQKK